ncbi:Hypothetical predicted protein [Podarcis lilfordi]|uniref:Uncharacterized protein n=2 Tax=Podarcis lilfordi TaxID=74358 RepID=A0AA35K5B3_9SAUR|nr:Hypothetical predicted protein [Podarcis lilfordi]
MRNVAVRSKTISCSKAVGFQPGSISCRLTARFECACGKMIITLSVRRYKLKGGILPSSTQLTFAICQLHLQ